MLSVAHVNTWVLAFSVSIFSVSIKKKKKENNNIHLLVVLQQFFYRYIYKNIYYHLKNKHSSALRVKKENNGWLFPFGNFHHGWILFVFYPKFRKAFRKVRALSPEEFLLLYKQHYLTILLFYFLFFLVLHWQCRQQHHQEKWIAYPCSCIYGVH